MGLTDSKAIVIIPAAISNTIKVENGVITKKWIVDNIISYSS